MTRRSDEDRLADKTELLESLHGSVRRVRQQAETLFRDLAAGEDGDIAQVGREIAAAEGLIRTCQKVEASLVEQLEKTEGVAGSAGALDLDWARSEVRSRLDRLRTSAEADPLSE